MHSVIGSRAVARGNAAEQARALARGGLSLLSARRETRDARGQLMSVERAVETGEDILRAISDVEVYAAARTVRDTQKGEELARDIETLERLIRACEDGALLEQPR